MATPGGMATSEGPTNATKDRTTQRWTRERERVNPADANHADPEKAHPHYESMGRNEKWRNDPPGA